MARIGFQTFGNKRSNCHWSEKAHPAHTFSHAWNELHSQLIGNEIEPQRIKRTFTVSDRIVNGHVRKIVHGALVFYGESP